MIKLAVLYGLSYGSRNREGVNPSVAARLITLSFFSASDPGIGCSGAAVLVTGLLVAPLIPHLRVTIAHIIEVRQVGILGPWSSWRVAHSFLLHSSQISRAGWRRIAMVLTPSSNLRPQSPQKFAMRSTRPMS